MYARHSLYNECEAQSRNGGLVHLTVASVYLELGGFRRCLEVIEFSAGFSAPFFFYCCICGRMKNTQWKSKKLTQPNENEAEGHESRASD